MEPKEESQLRILAEIGPLLASTLDYDETLSRVAQLAVDKLSDLSIIDVLDDSGTVRRLKVVARDPAQQPICDGLVGIRLDSTGPFLGAAALRTKSPVLMRRPRPEDIESLAHDEEDRRLLRSVRIRSLIAAPLLAREKLLGGLVLISQQPSRLYTRADVRLAEELARRAALALDNARLYRAAQQATAARDEMVAVVAHDLRNPLYGILLNAEILGHAREVTGTRLRQPVERIIASATRINRLISDLLDVRRIEAHGLPIDRDAVSVEDILTDTIDSQRAAAAAAFVSLKVDVSGLIAPVWGDRHRVLQIMENLVGNALKFTPRGGEVVVGAHPRGPDILFWVRDTGRGIAPQDLNRVFDRFWQARPTPGSGAGLGLSIVKGIVEAHGGSVWLQSTLGRGTTVFFTLPAAHPGDGGLLPQRLTASSPAAHDNCMAVAHDRRNPPS